MPAIQTLTLNRKKFAVVPYSEYQKLLAKIEDMQDLAEIKRRAKEPRTSLEEVKQKYLRNRK